jgi:hypothetical protein
VSRTTLFWSVDQTGQLGKLMNPDKDSIRQLFETLPRKRPPPRWFAGVRISYDGPHNRLEDILEKLYFNIGHIASSERQRHGWHRSSGQPDKELRELARAASALLDKWGKCHREALERLFLKGVGYATHASGIIALRRAALDGVTRTTKATEPAADRGGPNRKTLATRITWVVAVAFYETTGENPLPHHRRGAHKARANFPGLLDKLFEILGIKANAEYQCKLLGSMRRLKQAAPGQPRAR